MKLLHLGDLHIGKRIGNLSLIEDQKYILNEILNVIDEKEIEVVMIAGDVYDRSIPSEEAVNLLDDFLVSLSQRKLKVLISAGNHDSVERLSFGSRLIESSGIYISPEYDGNIRKVSLEDQYGIIDFYLLPFLKPAYVRHVYPDEEIETVNDAVRVAVNKLDIDKSHRNIILSHQYVTGAKSDGSEDELSLGGTNAVEASVYDGFDYVALGHVHRPQNVLGGRIRYCGSPMKFSFDEEKQNKGLTVVDIGEEIKTEVLPLKAKRDFVIVKGRYSELIKGNVYCEDEDFVHIVLSDEDDIPNAFNNLSVVYRNLISLEYDNRRTRNSTVSDGGDIDMSLSPYELIEEFYHARNDADMNEEQKNYIRTLIPEVFG